MDATKSIKDLLAMAKQQLSLPAAAPDARVPKYYLEDLKIHTKFFPHDTNFKIVAEPTRGFGRVVCQESGCASTVIVLSRHPKLADGGKKDGIGCLDAYKLHINAHPTHSKSRHARVKAASGVRTNSSSPASTPTATSIIKKESILDLLDGKSPSLGTQSPFSSSASPNPRTNSSSSVNTPASIVKKESILGLLDGKSPSLSMSRSSSSSFAPSTRPTPRSSLVRLGPVKAEPQEAVIPQKRLSNVAFEFDAHQSASASASTSAIPSTPPKRARLEPPATPKKPRPLAKKPLVPVDSNSAENVVNHRSAIDIQQLRYDVENKQSMISKQQQMLDTARRKANKTKADLTRIKRLESDVKRFRDEKAAILAKIPQMSPMKKATLPTEPKPEPLPLMLPPLLNAAGPSTVVRGNPFAPSTNPVPPAFQYRDVKPVPKREERRSSLFQDMPSSDAVYPPTSDADYDSDGMSVDGDADAMAAGVVARVAHAIPKIAPVARYDEDADQRGDWHGRGKDTFEGPKARAEDISHFLANAVNVEQFDGNASLDKALVKLGLPDSYTMLPSMEVTLMPHQAIGVAWMVDKEESAFLGGCLADDMGLGKTIQMISLMMHNRSKDPVCKTNLILAPTALLDQWKMEIELKTNDALRVLIYHGSSKPRSKKQLLEYDVVLTTFTTCAMEWPDFEGQKARKLKQSRKSGQNFVVSDSDSDGDVRVKKKAPKKHAGLLFQIDFYRVILDEAQNIRNKKTRISRAVTQLNAKYRWCLTGTPIINGLSDAYPIIRFLRIRPWYDFDEFHDHIGKKEKKQPDLAVVRLQALFSTFLLRRMKDSMLDGKRLIELPEKTLDLVKLDFSEEERDIYKAVEARTQARFNRYLRAGTVLKNYAQVLVLLLRLRQICSHPSLIQEDGVAFIAPDEDDGKWKPEHRDELNRARREMGSGFVTQMREKFKEKALQRMEDEKESADATADDEECPICFDIFTEAVVTPCGHLYCKGCIHEVLRAALPENPNPDVNEYKLRPNERHCPSCRSPISAKKVFSRAAFEPSDEDLSPKEEGANDEEDSDIEMAEVISRKKSKGKGKAKKPYREEDDVVDLLSDEEDEEEQEDDRGDMDDFIVSDNADDDDDYIPSASKKKKGIGKRKAFVVVDSEDEIEEESPEEKEIIFGRKKKKHLSEEAIKLMPRFLPSTKMKYMMQTIRELAETKPDEKTLVVSQWTGCLSLVSEYLSEAGIPHVKYQGDMNRSKRDQAVRIFMGKENARVMLMSLKCGGVGLNLTRANNVISLDLGWSQAIEAQAFDRVHRLGQTREVKVRKLVISNTVEDRVLDMQERKQNLADGSLGEGKGKKIGRLSVKELANLFGLDHRGHVLPQAT